MAKTDERSALVTSPSSKDRSFSMDIEMPSPVMTRRSNWLSARLRWAKRQWWCSFGVFAVLLWTASVVWYMSSHNAVGPVTPNPRFQLSFASSVHNEPITGRLLVCIAKKHTVEDPLGDDQPRFLIDDTADTQQVFAVDVWDFNPDTESREVNATHAHGYPVLSMLDIPEDEYWVQGVLHPYVLYNRSDGHELWLPSMDTFENDILDSPGTLFTRPQLIKYHPGTDFSATLVLDQAVEPLPSLEADLPTYDQQSLLQHIKFRSELLSAFWGTDVYLKAWILLPHKFFDPSTAHIKYPLFVYHSHYSREFEFDYTETKPDPETASDRDLSGFYLYSNWTSESPDSAFFQKRGIIVQLQHANPYYDDSYAVNSANIGPYGDAITYEFLPFIESKFRGIGNGWGRTMYGGSTGGWESLAVQVFYPDEYNGCWSFCPDSFDFRKFQIVNLLEDPNAYYVNGDWTRKNRGASRDYLGHIKETMEQENHHEMLMGSRGRSGGQWDAWQAVYSPVNESDGYPAAIWDKLTGEINHDVVSYWEEHYDVRVKLQREWEAKGLGEKLVNKLHVYVGVLDSYYLNDAVYYLEDFLESTRHPYYNGTIEYGVHDGKGYEHCWTGSFDETLSTAWGTLNQRIVPQMVDHIVMSAPANVSLDFTSY
ncbi:hypothetical protein Poli38472_007389 [Pythium oligandrum]|uniref:Uncharacterized protein n=1 Tax=Pythium oligandrum TaxID=41045 RepID=A0A8K1C9L4_PYTOL|nr:hypothetical protein Poli38472_007389 [Pythium oligandrum]|eukprot:TMW59244.1 hypothetical protein Poli38472_007389 [Pythium oligandrum]